MIQCVNNWFLKVDKSNKKEQIPHKREQKILIKIIQLWDMLTGL